MVRILLNSWRSGMNKIEVDKLLARDAGLGLVRAKRIVDALLDGESQSIALESSEHADVIMERLRRYGIDCEIAGWPE